MRGVPGTRKVCGVAGCGELSRAFGYCTKHAHRFKRHGDPLGGGAPKLPRGTLRQWILDHADYVGDECIVWPFHIERHGYSRVSVDGKREMAHRWMCRLKNGPAPSPEHEAAHSCGRGAEGCLNPNHLRWATPAENQADRLIHGTDCRGEKSPVAKLTAEQVIQIRALEGAATRQEIADRFGVTRQNVLLIQRRKSWAWLGSEAV